MSIRRPVLRGPILSHTYGQPGFHPSCSLHGCPCHPMQECRRTTGKNEGIPRVRWCKARTDGMLGREERARIPYGTPFFLAVFPIPLMHGPSSKKKRSLLVKRFTNNSCIHRWWQQPPRNQNQINKSTSSSAYFSILVSTNYTHYKKT